MTYIITKHPHPLDAIWDQATEALADACAAMDNLPEDYSNEEADALGERITAAVLVVMALPARNVGDTLYKFNAAGVDDSSRARTDCDLNAIMNEGLDLIDQAVDRGRSVAA